MKRERLIVAGRLLIAFVLAGCASIISSDKALTSFGFVAADNVQLPADFPGVISGTNIEVRMPYYLNRRDLVARFESTGVMVQVLGENQVSGVDAHDFSSPVEYVVSASDGTTQTYRVDAAADHVKCTAVDAQANDAFGSSVSMDGDYAVVGAREEDAKGAGAGAAYVFHRIDANSWDSGTKLVADDGEDSARFGSSVSISGDYVLVGAPGSSIGAGAAYVFHRTDTTGWDAGVKLIAADPNPGDGLGSGVSISGDYAVAAAPGDGAGGIGAGAVYVFHRAVGGWDAGVKITPSDIQADDAFGTSVFIDGEYLIVGAYQEDTNGEDAGAAYVFHRIDTTSWDSGTKLLCPDGAGGERFGFSVSVSGDYAIVGVAQMAAYVFRRTGATTWDTGVKIAAFDVANGDDFGKVVSINGDFALVGAIGEDTGGELAGAAYLFHRTGTNSWDAGTKLLASDAGEAAYFGGSACISGEYAVVGASGADTSSFDEGAAYIFH